MVPKVYYSSRTQRDKSGLFPVRRRTHPPMSNAETGQAGSALPRPATTEQPPSSRGSDEPAAPAPPAGTQLLGGLILGSSCDVAVDSAGSVHWQIRPRTAEVGLNFLVKLSPL
jgi:hypothetical protein